MNYDNAVRYILEIPKFTSKNSLACTKDFLRRLGNPGSLRKILHVAGTNGKGSVCAFLQAILQAENKKVGLFTSPHLVKMNERIQINGEAVDDEVFLQAFHMIMDIVRIGVEEGMAHPTFFEFLFAMGMFIFEEQQVEYIILETGLGGRYDATNVIDSPLVTIITSISLDHTAILGDTIEQIAFEKAGIIKQHVPVIADASNKDAVAVIRERAKIMEAPCREITNNAFEIKEINGKDIAFTIKSTYYGNTLWHVNSYGRYQVNNAVLALQAMSCITKEKDVRLTLWVEAIRNMTWPCRMEEIREGVIIDGAHNMGAIEAFVESVHRICYQQKGKTVLLFAAVEDKHYEAMIAYLAKHLVPNKVFVTQLEEDRAVKAERLAHLFRENGVADVKIIEDIGMAFAEAVNEKKEYDRLFCLGSLYLAGKIKAII